MNFSPRMQSRIHGFAVEGELKWRVWDGVVADVWHVGCSADAEGYYISPDPRLFVLLDLDPGGAFVLSQPDAGTSVRHDAAGSMSFVPAGVPVAGKAEGLSRMSHLDLHFPESAVTRRFGKTLDRAGLLAPRLHFRDPTIEALARAIAEECARPSPLHDLLGEGLVNALLTLLFEVPRDAERRSPGLSRQQLALVTEFIEAHCFESIRLADLAALAKLSETYFSHAFKASTGLPPHRWQMQARIRKVQEKLLRDDRTLSEVATASGFSDQAHFTRVFKSVVGLTPAEWRRGAAGRAP